MLARDRHKQERGHIRISSMKRSKMDSGDGLLGSRVGMAILNRVFKDGFQVTLNTVLNGCKIYTTKTACGHSHLKNFC